MKPWIYTDNVFENCTEHNYLKMLIICGFTDGVLKEKSTDPAIAPLYAFFHPLALAYQEIFGKWEGSELIQIGSTSGFDSLLADLSNPTVGDWDVSLQMIYRKGSPQYNGLMPHGRKPFQTGRKDKRVGAVKALSEALTGDAALVGLKALVDAAYAALLAARTAQAGKIGDVKDFSDEVEAARLAVAAGMMFVYGSLVALYYNNLRKVDNFFDLENIRHHHQIVFTRSVKKGEVLTLFKHQFHASDKVKFEVFDDAGLEIGCMLNKDVWSGSGYTGAPNSSADIDVALLGDYIHNFYFTVRNTTLMDGKCRITLL